MSQPKPLDAHQLELLNLVRAAHKTLAVARKTRTSEQARRLAEGKLNWERTWEREQERIKLDLDAELQAHAANLDEALIAAYTEGVPVRRIAIDGFGNRYDGGVQQLLAALRADGRVGSSESYQRNTEASISAVIFPAPIDLASIISQTTAIAEPKFTLREGVLDLVPASEEGADGISVQAVDLELDPRDPWFASIKGNARVGTPFRHATTVTLYEHPATGELMTLESKETGELIWDHPVARWVKDNPSTAREGFNAALAATSPEVSL